MNGRNTILSRRELELVRAVVNPELDGHKAIAHQMGLSVGTVKAYLNNIFRKLGWATGSMLQLALWAIAYRVELKLALPTQAQFKGYQIAWNEPAPAAA